MIGYILYYIVVVIVVGLSIRVIRKRFDECVLDDNVWVALTVGWPIALGAAVCYGIFLLLRQLWPFFIWLTGGLSEEQKRRRATGMKDWK